MDGGRRLYNGSGEGRPELRFAGRLLWYLQAISGGLLVLLAGVHWVAQHYVASGGLRSYAETVSFLRNPLAFGLEVTFLIVVTAHALLGVRAILMDFGPGKPVTRIINLALVAIGLLTVWYGIDLVLGIIQ